MKKLFFTLFLAAGSFVLQASYIGDSALVGRRPKLLFYNYTGSPVEAEILFVNAGNPAAEVFKGSSGSFKIDAGDLVTREDLDLSSGGLTPYLMVYRNIGSAPAMTKEIEELGIKTLKDIITMITKNDDQIAAMPLGEPNKNGFYIIRAMMTGPKLQLNGSPKLTPFELDLFKELKHGSF